MSSAQHPRGLFCIFLAAVASGVWAGGCADPQLPDRGDFEVDPGDEGGQPSASGGNESATGGRVESAGGRASSGGRTSQGGETGGAASGGNSETSGGASSAASGGTRTGGTSATGGVTTGGLNSTGGSKSTGGVSAMGGNSTTGGIGTTGGVSASGGTKTTGGVSATGGVMSTGGAASSGGGPNLLKSSGFEGSSTDGWRKRGTAMVTVSTEQAHSGTHALMVTGRTAGWHGAEYDVLSLVKAGDSYTVSVWARPAYGSVTSSLMLTRELQGCGATDYVWLGSVADATDAAWVELSGTLTIPSSCAPTKLVIYVESSNATLSYYVDDTSMRKP